MLVLQAAHASDLKEWEFHLFSVIKSEEGGGIEKKKEKKKGVITSGSKKGREGEEKEVERERSRSVEKVDKGIEKVGEKQEKGVEKTTEKGNEKGNEKVSENKGQDGGHKWEWMKPKMPVFCYVCKKLAFRQEGYECMNCNTWVHSSCGAQVATSCEVLQKRYKKHGTFQRV